MKVLLGILIGFLLALTQELSAEMGLFMDQTGQLHQYHSGPLGTDIYGPNGYSGRILSTPPLGFSPRRNPCD